MGRLDLAWLFENELSDPLMLGYPFKFLTVYQDDFKKNHIVLYGPDPAERLPEYPKPQIYCWRAGRLKLLAQERRGNREMLLIVAGEAARLYALVHGAPSISKTDILRTLERLASEDVVARALVLWRCYIEGRDPGWSEDELVRLVDDIAGLVADMFNCR